MHRDIVWLALRMLIDVKAGPLEKRVLIAHFLCKCWTPRLMNFWFQAGISHLAESLGWWRQRPPVAMNPTLPNSFLDTFRWQIWWLSNLGTFVNPIEFCDLQPVGFSVPSSWRVKHRNRCLAGETSHRASVIIHRLGLAKAWDDRWDSGRGASGKWEEDLKAVECLGSDYEQCEQERMWWRKGPTYWRLLLPKHAMIQCQWLKKTSCFWSRGTPMDMFLKGIFPVKVWLRNSRTTAMDKTAVLTWLKLPTRGMSQDVSGYSRLELVQTEILWFPPLCNSVRRSVSSSVKWMKSDMKRNWWCEANRRLVDAEMLWVMVIFALFNSETVGRHVGFYNGRWCASRNCW